MDWGAHRQRAILVLGCFSGRLKVKENSQIQQRWGRPDQCLTTFWLSSELWTGELITFPHSHRGADDIPTFPQRLKLGSFSMARCGGSSRDTSGNSGQPDSEATLASGLPTGLPVSQSVCQSIHLSICLPIDSLPYSVQTILTTE